MAILYNFVIGYGSSLNIETDPGPDFQDGTSNYSCSYHVENVCWEDRVICFDTSISRYHVDFQGMYITKHSILNKFTGNIIAREYI